MRIGSLFSGYGGLDLGVMAALGGDVVWHCDTDPAANLVLSHHWPDVPNLGDITAVNWATVPAADVITAGYPCQPFSDAGQRRAEEDDRYLWPEVARCLGVVGPRLVVLENVRGHLGRGFSRVLGDLSDLGYDTEWTTLRAADVGAPHRRERLFVAAYARCDARPEDHPHGAATARRGGAAADPARDGRHERRAGTAGQLGRPDVAERGGTAADADELGRTGLRRLQPGMGPRPDPDGRIPVDWGQYGPAVDRWQRVLGRPAPDPTEPGRNRLRLSSRFTEWLMGLPAGWVTDVPGVSRNAALRLLGNGVVPQQAETAIRHLMDREAIAA